MCEHTPAEFPELSVAIQERESSVITREHASISDSSSAFATVGLGRKRTRQNKIKRLPVQTTEKNLILFYELVLSLIAMVPNTKPEDIAHN